MSEITVPGELMLDGLRLSSPAQVNRSAWTGRRKVIGGPGREVWRGQASIDTITTETEERPWRAFLFRLEGPANWFRWKLPCNSHIGPKPVVATGSGAGYAIALSGMSPSTTLLHAGQFIAVPLPSGHVRAVCLVTDLVTDSSGNATVTFRPALGEIPTLGATVETADPYIPVSMTESEQGFSLSDGISATSFDVEEAR